MQLDESWMANLSDGAEAFQEKAIIELEKISTKLYEGAKIAVINKQTDSAHAALQQRLGILLAIRIIKELKDE